MILTLCGIIGFGVVLGLGCGAFVYFGFSGFDEFRVFGMIGDFRWDVSLCSNVA